MTVAEFIEESNKDGYGVAHCRPSESGVYKLEVLEPYADADEISAEPLEQQPPQNPNLKLKDGTELVLHGGSLEEEYTRQQAQAKKDRSIPLSVYETLHLD